MAKYKLQGPDETSGVFDTETGASIPNAPGNRHWYEYTQWKLGLDINGNELPGSPGIQSPDSQFTLSELKNNKKLELRADCKTEIESGWTSAISISSTGLTYNYESELKDQTNLVVAVETGVSTNFVAINAGNKELVLHTNSELTSILDEWTTLISAIKEDLYEYYADVDAAVDEAAVNAISWSYPHP